MEAIYEEDGSEAWGDHAANTHSADRPDRSLARTPAAEVASAQKDARPTIAGLIKNEVRIFRAVRHEPQGLERPGTQIVSFGPHQRSEEPTSELQSLMRISYAVFCLKKKNKHKNK